jgi:WbqC-like protein family
MTTIVISQPLLFPWPGFFELLSQADIFVHLDDVQFSRGSFTNRIQIKHPSGMKWMTVPLVGKGKGRSIIDLEATGTDWKGRHRALILQALRGAPHINVAIQLFDRVYSHEPLVSLLISSVEESAKAIGLERPVRWLRSSRMGIVETSWRRVLAIVRSLGGNRYVTAHGGAQYLDHETFEQTGVMVEYVDYSMTPYPQLHGPFLPHVTVLDLIANLGPSAHTALRSNTVSWRDFISHQQISPMEDSLNGARFPISHKRR